MGTSVRGFWIDQECIDQDNEAEKQRAVQSIEYVYSYSAFPVALLSVQIESEDQLKNLVYILGEVIHSGMRKGTGSAPSSAFRLYHI